MTTTLTLKQEEELIRAQTAAIVAAGQELRAELAAIDAEYAVSNCCAVPMSGEPSNNFTNPEDIEGRCSDCKEMASFTIEAESQV